MPSPRLTTVCSLRSRSQALRKGLVALLGILAVAGSPMIALHGAWADDACNEGGEAGFDTSCLLCELEASTPSGLVVLAPSGIEGTALSTATPQIPSPQPKRRIAGDSAAPRAPPTPV